ncbi:MAG: GNAT family N-acetyltransferase [Litoreibacter sp.]
MAISDLAPDLTFPRLGSTAAEMEFALDAKRAAMAPHITQKWGWDKNFQREVHQQRFAEKPFLEIRTKEQRLGTVSFTIFLDHVRFGEFYLFPEFQNQGTGSRVLEHCLEQAKLRSLPIRLEYLRWSPVGSLYRRNGFVQTGESDIHYFMERSVR